MSKKAIQGSLILGSLSAITIIAIGSIKYPPPVLNVYSDPECTTEITQIAWGEISPGASVMFPIYVKNNGIVPFRLTIFEQDWIPEAAPAYIDMVAYSTKQELLQGEVVPFELTLYVDSTISGIYDFSFNIVLSAEQLMSLVAD